MITINKSDCHCPVHTALHDTGVRDQDRLVIQQRYQVLGHGEDDVDP